jgi:hypothetical protein
LLLVFSLLALVYEAAALVFGPTGFLLSVSLPLSVLVHDGSPYLVIMPS